MVSRETTPPSRSPWKGRKRSARFWRDRGVSCNIVGIGRLPRKTLGVNQLVDGYGEPLWYAVKTGTWALVNNGDVLTINPGLLEDGHVAALPACRV